MTDPLVTIMMPTRNRAHFLLDAIGSVLGQSYKNWELIIVDDGSDKTTKTLCIFFQELDRRIRYYKTRNRMTIPQARNRALRLSRGSFVGHLDDDDLLHRNAIGEIVKEFKKNRQLALVYSDFLVIDDAGEKIIREDIGPDFNRNNLLNLGFRHFTIYKKSAAMNVGGFNEHVWCEDGDLFMQIAQKHECKHIPKFLYFYRSHATNIGHRRPTCQTCDRTAVCNYYKIWEKQSRKMTIMKNA